MRFQLIPNDPDIGKMPYLWLVYLGFFAVPYLIWPPHGWLLAAVLSSIAIFLILYFRAFWAMGIELWCHLLGIGALGILWAPHSYGASCFLIYSACLSSRLPRPRQSACLIGMNLLACGLAAWHWHLGMEYYGPGMFFSILFGASSIFETEGHRNRRRLLRQQEEIEHLAKLAERERISRDLHDVVGHALTVIAMKSELARKLAAREGSQAVGELVDIESTTRDMLQQVRAAISGYRSAGLDFELAQAEKTLQTAQVQLALGVEAVRLAPMAENILSLALREAVTNVIRHGKARHCRIVLRKSDGKVLFDISDDGVGVGGSVQGNGLRGMRERIESIGGGMVVDSGQNGTRLAITLPAQMS